MKKDDRVRHRKYGYGTVKAVYPKNNACRVLYDPSPAYPDGHETTNAQSRVQVLTAGQSAGKTETAPPEPSDVRVTRRSSSGTSRVDYKAIDRCVELISAKFPDADRVVGKIYNDTPYCEVWKNGAADIHFLKVAA